MLVQESTLPKIPPAMSFLTKAECPSHRADAVSTSTESPRGSVLCFRVRQDQIVHPVMLSESDRFQRGAIATGLELIPDQGPPPVNHGVLAPVQVVPLANYQTDLANTRADWQIDET